MAVRPRQRALVPALAVVLAMALTVAACSSPGTGNGSVAPATSIPRRPTIAATTDVMASLAAVVAGDDADVIPLLLRGQVATDSHPSDDVIQRARGADLVLAVGGGWEPWLSDLGSSRTLEVAPLLNPIPLGGSELTGASTPAGAVDPRFWLDPDRTTQAARRIGDELVALGLDRAAVQGRVDAFTADLARADEAAQATLGPIPDGRRTLYAPTAHVGYLADRYGFTVVHDLAAAPTASAMVIDAAAARPGGTGPPTATSTVPVAVLHLDAFAPVGPPIDVPTLIEGNAAALASAVG